MDYRTTILERVRQFFAKENKTETVPEGMCANCWGYQEYNDQYYEVVRDKRLHKDADKYEHFISKVVDQHTKNTQKIKNTYVCITCDEVIEVITDQA